MTEATPHIEFIIGEEKRLSAIIGRAEVEPLLRSALKLGISRAALLDEDGLPLALAGNSAESLTGSAPGGHTTSHRAPLSDWLRTGN